MKYSNRSHGIATLLGAAPLIYLALLWVSSNHVVTLEWFVIGLLGFLFPSKSNFSNMIPIGLSVMTVAFHYYVIAALFDGYLIFMGIEALVALGLSKMILNDADNKSLSISNALSIVTLVVLSLYFHRFHNLGMLSFCYCMPLWD